MSEKRYTLKIAYFPIAPDLGGVILPDKKRIPTGYRHTFFRIYDNEGALKYEINGFAADQDGNPKSVGHPLDSSDRIKVFIDNDLRHLSQ